MTKHFSDRAFLSPTACRAFLDKPLIERRDADGGDQDDPLALATRAVDDLRTASDAFRTEIGDRLTTELRSIGERIDGIETRMQRPGQQRGDGDGQTPERRAFATYLRRGDATSADEIRAMTASSDPSGGYLTPPEFSSEFIRNLVQFSPLRSLASVRQITGPSVSYPKRTGVTNAQWENETDDQPESTVALGQVNLAAKTLTTFVDISNQLLADSGGTAEAEVRQALAEDFGQKEGLAFLSGNGVLAPEGILLASGVSTTVTGNASTLGSAPADLLITVMYGLPAAYRTRGTWLMNGGTLAAIRKLKDGQNNYLWQPSYVAGQPETILGRPVAEMPDMDDIGAGTTPIAFGDIATAYRIVDRLDMSVLVNPYLLATKQITRIHATRRVGGAVVQPAAIKKIKCST